jgi:hypothetical protein
LTVFPFHPELSPPVVLKEDIDLNSSRGPFCEGRGGAPQNLDDPVSGRGAPNPIQANAMFWRFSGDEPELNFEAWIFIVCTEFGIDRFHYPSNKIEQFFARDDICYRVNFDTIKNDFFRHA